MMHNLNYSRNVMTTEIDLDTNLIHFFRPFFFFRSRLNYRSGPMMTIHVSQIRMNPAGKN